MHSLRVYHQVQAWLGNTLPEDKSGWHRDPKLSPIRSPLGPAPSKILNSIVFAVVQSRAGARAGAAKQDFNVLRSASIAKVIPAKTLEF